MNILAALLSQLKVQRSQVALVLEHTDANIMFVQALVDSQEKPAGPDGGEEAKPNDNAVFGANATGVIHDGQHGSTAST